MARLDTVALKMELADALGAERGARYWTALGRTITGEISPQGFAIETAQLLLTRHEQSLHNRLILGILTNATRYNVPPPPKEPHTEFKPTGKYPVNSSVNNTLQSTLLHRRSFVTGGIGSFRALHGSIAGNNADSAANDAVGGSIAKKGVRRLSKFLTVQALDDGARRAIEAAKEKAKKFPKHSIPTRFQVSESADVQLADMLNPELQARIQTLSTCRQAGAVPSLETLRARMQVIGTLHNIKFEPDCFAFTEQALSTYLKDIITSVQERVRQSTQPEISFQENGVRNLNNSSMEQNCALSCKDLQLSTLLTPILLRRSPGSVDTIEQMIQ